MSRFEEEIKNYSQMYYDTKEELIDNGGTIAVPLKIIKMTKETLKANFEADNDDFRKFCCSLAKSLTKNWATKVHNSMTYAAAVSLVAKYLGVDHEVKLSVTADKDIEDIEEIETYFKKSVEEGVLHPYPLTSMYVKVGLRCYEFSNGKYEGFVHLETVDLAPPVHKDPWAYTIDYIN